MVRHSAFLILSTHEDCDISVRAAAKALDPEACQSREVMSQGVVYCAENRSVEDSAHRMEEKKVRRLPVLDEEKHLVGIVSIANLAIRAHNGNVAGKVLERVSAQDAAH